MGHIVGYLIDRQDIEQHPQSRQQQYEQYEQNQAYDHAPGVV
jgi:hypothetical protein